MTASVPTLADTSTDAGIDTWRRFVSSLRETVPAIPPNAAPELDITRSGILDHPARTALRQTVALSRPELAPQAIELAATLGDLAALVDTEPVAPHLLVRGQYHTAHVRLAPLTPAHIPAMYEASLDPSTSFRWRFRGRTPSPEEFQAALFSSVMAQYAVVGIASGSVLGVVTAYDEHLDAGHCSVAFERIGSDDGGATVIEGLALFVDYLFTTFPLRKVFGEVPEYNLVLIESLLDDLARIEGRIRDYYWYNGRHWDRLVVSVGRGAWESWVAPWVGADVRLGSSGPVPQADQPGESDTDSDAVAAAQR